MQYCRAKVDNSVCLIESEKWLVFAFVGRNLAMKKQEAISVILRGGFA